MYDTSPETLGVWKIRGDGGLVYNWDNLPDFIPTDLDVLFNFGFYNYDIQFDREKNIKFYTQYNIKEILELVEYYHPPRSDMDSSFKGRALFAARFDNIKDAIYFKMASSNV